MTEHKWTPGPWVVVDEPRHSTASVCNNDSWNFDKSAVCDIPYEKTFTAEYAANAHLIAAAPGLYWANQGAIDSLEFALYELTSNDMISQDDADLIVDRIAALQLAATKARGEQ